MNLIIKEQKLKIKLFQRYYEREYNKTVNIIAETGNIPYQDAFNYESMKSMYKDIILDIAVFFAIWYADNIETYLKNG